MQSKGFGNVRRSRLASVLLVLTLMVVQIGAYAGVTCMLFGVGVGSSTDAVGDTPGDDYW